MSPRTCGAAMRNLGVVLKQPGHESDRANERRQPPDHQHQLPVAAEHMLERHGGRGRQRRSDADQHGVETHHRADMAGKVALDDRRAQDAEEAQTRTDHDRAEIERSDTEAAHHAADGDPEKRREKNCFDPEAPRQRRHDGSKQAEANHRQHGQDADAEGGNTEVVPDVADEQCHRRDGGPQIKSDQQDGDDGPGRMPQQRRTRPATDLTAAAFCTSLS